MDGDPFLQSQFGVYLEPEASTKIYLASIITNKKRLGGSFLVALLSWSTSTDQHSSYITKFTSKNWTERVSTNRRFRYGIFLYAAHQWSSVNLGFPFRSMANTREMGTFLFHLHALAGKGGVKRGGRSSIFHGTRTWNEERGIRIVHCILSPLSAGFSNNKHIISPPNRVVLL